MSVELVFETHSTSVDNEANIASGWQPSKLSQTGREQAVALGERRGKNGFSAVIASDLGRVIETVRIAFGGTDLPVFYDWRLRECDYGALNGQPAADLHRDRRRYLDTPYPGGESWRQAIQRVGRFLTDVPLRWADARVLVIGHVATRWAFDHLLDGVALEDLIAADFNWREGWEYRIP